MKQLDIFENVDFYKEQIEPLVKEIKAVCNANKIPFFMSFAIAADEDGKIEYKRDALTPASLKVKAANCEIYPLICVVTGSKAVLVADVPEIEFEEAEDY